MATTQLSYIDELEKNDRRFSRHPNGRLRSNFSAGGAVGADWVRKYDAYLDDMRKDAANWRRDGNLADAERAENQVMWESAQRQRSHASKRFHASSNPDEKARYHELMLEADRDAEMSEQRQFQSDEEHDSQWVETRERQQREHQEAQRKAEADRQASEDAKKPLRERLQGEDLNRYNQARDGFNKKIKLLQGGDGEILDKPGYSEWFDRQYEVLMKGRANEKTGEVDPEPEDSAKAKRPVEPTEEVQAAPGQKPAGEEQGGHAAPQETRAADGKQHSPLLKQHQGYRAQVSDDQSFISYHKGDSQKASFTDHGNRVSLSKDTYQDDQESLKAALRHADEKFERFDIRGSREHQEASARMAERLGIGAKVNNQDLQEIIEKERELIAKERAEQAQREREGGHQQSGEGGQKQPVEIEEAVKPAYSEAQHELDSTRQARPVPRPPESESGAQSKAAESVAQRAENAHTTSDVSKAGQTAARAESAQPIAPRKPPADLPKPPGYDDAKAANQGEKASESKDGLPPPPSDKGPGDSAGQSEKSAGARLKLK